MSAPRRDPGRRWNLIAFVLGTAAVVVLLTVPFGSSVTVDSSGQSVSESVSLLDNEGPVVLLVLAAPVMLLGVPLLISAPRAARRVRVTVAALLGLLTFLGALSIGVFFLPAWLSMVASAAMSNVQTPPDVRELQGGAST